MGDMKPLVSIDKLRVEFRGEDGPIVGVENVSFTIAPGETVCVVGESGSGKSVTSLSLMRLVEFGGGAITGGELSFETGKGTVDLAHADASTMQAIRGNEIGMIFQEPMTSLNPVFIIGAQIGEAVRLHEKVTRAQARDRAIQMLRLVGIPSPERRVDDYPHQLSGGMRQRAMIAIALACNPALLIADEPTTALDVTIQAQILDLMRDLSDRTGAAIMLITHDLGVVAETCDDVVVMYAGKVVERAPAKDLFDGPMHPYTLGLMAAVPRLDTDADRLETIPGAVPPPWAMPAGCRFASRCPLATDQCRQSPPPLREIATNRLVACWRAPIEEIAA